MSATFAVGRIALVVIFIYSGANKLIDISATADAIQSKLAIPSELGEIVSQIETATGMSIWQILAILVAAVEVIAGLLIAFNVLTRTAAVILLLFAVVTTFFFHDFWNVATAAEKTNQLNHALKNLAIMGALLMLASLPRRPVVAEPVGADRLEPL
jgi:putative oxidoreductase